MAGLIHFAQRKVINRKQSAWYDHTIYEIPYTGELRPGDERKVKEAMQKAFQCQQSLNKFGGQTHLGEIKIEGNKIIVEFLYSVGD